MPHLVRPETDKYESNKAAEAQLVYGELLYPYGALIDECPGLLQYPHFEWEFPWLWAWNHQPELHEEVVCPFPDHYLWWPHRKVVLEYEIASIILQGLDMQSAQYHLLYLFYL